MASLMQKDVLIEGIAATHALMLKKDPSLSTADTVVRELAQKTATLYRTPHTDIDFEANMRWVAALQKMWRARPTACLEEDDEVYFETMLNKIWEFLTVTLVSSEPVKPIVYLLGGQPGAGKSQWIKAALDDVHGGALVINGDTFRPYHREYERLFATYGETAPQHTAAFASQMIQAIRNRACLEKRSLILEGTFRTSHVPLGEINRFKAHGYDVRIRIATCPKAESWLSTQERTSLQLAWGLEARSVPQAHHDVTCEHLASCVTKVIHEGHVTDVAICSRGGVLFHQHEGEINLEDVRKRITQIME